MRLATSSAGRSGWALCAAATIGLSSIAAESQACMMPPFYLTRSLQDFEDYAKGDFAESYQTRPEYSLLRIRVVDFPSKEARTIEPKRGLKGVMRVRVIDTVVGPHLDPGEYSARFAAHFGCKGSLARPEMDQYVAAKRAPDGALELGDFTWLDRF